MASTKTAPTEANLHEAETRRKSLTEVYKKEKLVERSISPLYAPYLGKVIQISINGVTIAMPVDGSIQKVPESFGDEIDSRVMAINATLLKATKMSDVKSNIEHAPGALGMF